MEEMKYQASNYKSDQYVRWCPGCGDHAKIYIIKDNYNNDLKGFNLFLSISLVGIAHNFYSGCLALNSIHHINYIE